MPPILFNDELCKNPIVLFKNSKETDLSDIELWKDLKSAYNCNKDESMIITEEHRSNISAMFLPLHYWNNRKQPLRNLT